jgi:cytosine/adenosine deaminase-related metal-dependent hydrolase
LARLRRDYFSTNDQLLTLALHTGIDAEQWKLARSLGAPIVSHYISGDLTEAARAGLLGPDNEYIHCTQIGEADWKRIADTGGHVSIAPAIEMQMKHGMPPLQSALDHGLKPSLSVDVECNMAADMFTIMRSAFTLQRALANQRSLAGEKNAPKLMTAREAIEMATLHGARCAHLESKIGSLAPGKEADIILLATDRINVFPLNNVEGAVVTLMDTSNVDTVFIAGQVRKWRGALVGHDLAALRREMDRARDALFARAKRGSALFGSCCAP